VKTFIISPVHRKEYRCFQEQDTTRPSFCIDRVKCGKLMGDKIINFNDKVTDKNANRKEICMAFLYKLKF
jgi:hypothetical protein